MVSKMFHVKQSPKRKLETSKLLLLVLLTGLGIVTLTVVMFSFLSNEPSPLVTLVDGYIKLCSIAIGFYYWKAKCENMQKYKHTNKIGEISDAQGN